MAVVFKKTKGLTDLKTHYCPGCTHGIIHRLVAEVLEELGVLGETIGVAPVGCSVLAYNYFNCDMHEAAHGRAPAVATGIRRVHPDKVVFTYQGDGDLASIGAAEIVHAASRGEKFTTIFVNNAIYGMTGGQMAPTTLVGQKATTAPLGRDPKKVGMPLKVSEMLATLDGAKFVERCSVHNPAGVRKTKSAIKKAFEMQIRGEGFGIVEVLSTCPTNWGMTPVDSLKWLEENMIPYYPLGNIRTPEGGDK
ncbi:MAG: 2-oxoglutarate oxidoreductase [Bacteroidetes bacterium 4572_77]|nr:MAG: 2-oxoglutarate oxidoreductase [Bacteroidetes bacterium 4572_77]